jgi:hypothetical protein
VRERQAAVRAVRIPSARNRSTPTTAAVAAESVRSADKVDAPSCATPVADSAGVLVLHRRAEVPPIHVTLPAPNPCQAARCTVISTHIVLWLAQGYTELRAHDICAGHAAALARPGAHILRKEDVPPLERLVAQLNAELSRQARAAEAMQRVQTAAWRYVQATMSGGNGSFNFVWGGSSRT